MKKIVALLLSCMMLLCVTGALADTVTLPDPSSSFDVKCELPEGLTVDAPFVSDDFCYVMANAAENDAACSYILTIAPSEEYADVADLADLTDEQMQSILQVIIADCDEADYGVTTLASGDVMLYYIERGDDYEDGNLIDIHNGYFVQLSYSHVNYTTILESDTAAAEAFMDAITYEELK